MRGMIKKRGSKYSIVVDLYDEKGVRKRKWISGYEKKGDAEKDLPRILTEINGGTFVEERKITFNEFAVKWLKHVDATVSHSTFVTYEWAIKKANERFGTLPLLKLRPLTIQALLNETELSKTSIRYIYRVLNIAFDQAVKWQIMTNNPCKAITPPARNKKVFTPYSDAQIDKLIKGSKKTSIFLPVLIAITCGLRRGEICALDWANIDFDRNIIFVVDHLKTENSARAVSAPTFLMDEFKKARGIGPVVNLKPDYVYKRFVKLIVEMKLPDISFHDLRHLSASLLLKNGVPITVVSERLGHGSKSFTLDTYSHLLPNMQEHAAAKMNDIILGSKPVAKNKKAPRRKASKP